MLTVEEEDELVRRGSTSFHPGNGEAQLEAFSRFHPDGVQAPLQRTGRPKDSNGPLWVLALTIQGP